MKSVLLASFTCKTCSMDYDRRVTRLSLKRKNWLHVTTKCSRCNTANLVMILG